MPLDRNYKYVGRGFFEYLNPFSILVGLTSLALFMMHGAIYLLLKTEGKLYERLQGFIKKAMFFFIMAYILAAAYGFKENPVLFILPLLVFLSISNIPRLASKKRYGWALIFTSLTIALLLAIVAFEFYLRLFCLIPQ